MSHGTVTYDAKGFIINGVRKVLSGGEFHYFRTPAALWEDRIRKIRATGANLLTTYIPWNWHEPREGQELWTGDRDLVGFLKLTGKYGLHVIVKPGPYACAELDFGGHPDWLLGKGIRLRVLNEGYLAFVRKWYQRVAEVIRPYLVTNGGNIFAIQVENEYDHLLHYGSEKISLADAVEYFNRLKGMMEEFGIDIPKFANEAAFLRGTDIIETRTYYPNIPTFNGWSWQFEHYDDKILAAKKGQPGCPTMIMELQKGWFGAHGHPFYKPGIDHTQGVAKSSLICGASVLNFYMFAGGTTFPFWGSRGDIVATDVWGAKQNVNPAGAGLTTSFNFGGVITEWGAPDPVSYPWIRAFHTFIGDFSGYLADADAVTDLRVLRGGEDVTLVAPEGSRPDTGLESSTEKFRVISRKMGDARIVCVRNLGEGGRTVDIGDGSGNLLWTGLDLRPHETRMLPCRFTMPSGGPVILSSTAELLFSKQIGGKPWNGLSVSAGRNHETVLEIPASRVALLEGKNAKVAGDGSRTRITHVPGELVILDVDGGRLFLVDEGEAGSLEFGPEGILFAGVYLVRAVRMEAGRIGLDAEVLTGSTPGIRYVGTKRLASIGSPDLAECRISSDKEHTVVCRAAPESRVRFDWADSWKVCGDTGFAATDAVDTDWLAVEDPAPLEKIGLFEHGHLWYRMQVDLPEDLEHPVLELRANNNDRFYAYMNGQFLWRGITDLAEMDISACARRGRNVIAVLYENFYHNKSHPHEGELFKFSGLMEPLVVTGTVKGSPFRTEIRAMKVRPVLEGVRLGYAAPGFDDSRWLTVPASRRYVMKPSMGELVWMRRKFTIHADKEAVYAVRLTIRKASQRCFIYVNGHATGWYEDVGPQHDFYIPGVFLEKDNVLTLLLEGVDAVLEEPELGLFYEGQTARIEIGLT